MTKTLKSADKQITTVAVLNQCSNVTLCTDQLLLKLNVQGKTIPFTRKNVDDNNSRAADLIVTSTDSCATTASQVHLIKEIFNEELSSQLAQFWRYNFLDHIDSNKTSFSY